MGFWKQVFGTKSPVPKFWQANETGRLLDIVGEGLFQQNLDKIAGPKNPISKNFYCIATLKPELNNKFDKNAVSVWIKELQVGYLSKQDAEYYRKTVMVEHRLVIAQVSCRAYIVGGWREDDGYEGHYGVKLDVAIPFKALAPDEKLIPPPAR